MATKQAIPGKRSNLFRVDPSDLTIVGLDTEHGEGDHPLWDPRVELPVEEGLVRNVMVYGVIDPIKVRKEGEEIIVVDGRQRLRAAREANERLAAEGKEELLVPVVVKRGDDAFMFGVMVSANENRQDDDILAKANKASRMLAMGKDNKEVAIAFGVTEQAVRNWLAMLELHPEVIEKVKNGSIAASAAAKLAPLGRDEQVEALAEIEQEGPVTTAAAAAQTRVRRARQRGEDETAAASMAPKKRSVKKLIEYLSSLEEHDLDSEFVRGVRWAIGDLNTASIKGLSALLKEATGK